MTKPEPNVQAEFVELTPEQLKARNRRNIMLAFSIIGFVVLVFFITIARLKSGQPL